MTARDDLGRLMGSATKLAWQMLSEHGEFYPYGEVLLMNGEHVAIGVEIPGEHFPKGRDVARELDLALAKWTKKQDVLALARVANVAWPENAEEPRPDAVQVWLEHVDGTVVVVNWPYELHAGTLCKLEGFSQHAEPRWFR